MFEHRTHRRTSRYYAYTVIIPWTVVQGSVLSLRNNNFELTNITKTLDILIKSFFKYTSFNYVLNTIDWQNVIN